MNNTINMVPNIPEHIWAAIVNLLDASQWNPERPPASRIDALVNYCNWYFEHFGYPEQEADPDGFLTGVV